MVDLGPAAGPRAGNAAEVLPDREQLIKKH
jgi:hypothetical protein